MAELSVGQVFGWNRCWEAKNGAPKTPSDVKDTLFKLFFFAHVLELRMRQEPFEDLREALGPSVPREEDGQ